MFRLNPTRSQRARQARLRQEARYLKYWILKVRAAGLVLLLAGAAIPRAAHADASTGLADDPKDMSDQTTTTTTDVVSLSSPFLPLPGWSRFEKMPPLPDQLTPLGKKATPALAVTPVIARKDPGEATPAVFIPKPKDIPVVNNNPTLIAVSPFLQWIKDHPKDASVQARKEADGYNAPPAAANGPVPTPATAAGSGSPYWMPPLIDSGDTTAPAGSSSSTTSSEGSAALYSTPQRN